MSKLFSFSAFEDILIGLINLTICKSCGCFINYNGIIPEFCFDCEKENHERTKRKDI
jgi:hypothetical protein